MSLIEKLNQLKKQKAAAMADESLDATYVPKKKRRIGIVGAGTAGLLTLVHFCTWLDNDWEVYSIHNPAKAILGIGESTNGGFISLLERGTHFSIGKKEDMDALDATVKYGSKFIGWRKHSWINPLLDGMAAIHFNNFNFRNFVYQRLEKLWPEQFRVLEGDVTGMVNHPDRVVVTVDNEEHEFDYIVDCMGFPSSYDDYILSDCTPVNRCQIHNVTDYEFEPVTDHIAHANGWMFGVPLQGRKSFGYLYNDQITPKEEAIKDMQRYFETDHIDNKEYVFNCYSAKKLIDGRIAKNGNKALFFEPMIANSMFIYIFAARVMWDYMMEGADVEACNAKFAKAVREMEDVISYYYQGGSTFESEFWDIATRHTKARLQSRQEFKDQMDSYRQLKSRGILQRGNLYAYAPLTWEIIDEQLGYGYIAS